MIVMFPPCTCAFCDWISPYKSSRTRYDVHNREQPSTKERVTLLESGSVEQNISPSGDPQYPSWYDR